MKAGVCRTVRTGSYLAVASAIAALLLSLSPATVEAQSAAKPHRKVVVMIQPEYPDVLKNGHFEGQVRLEATVLPSGLVSKVDVKGGNPMLSKYASQAVEKWKYVPGPSQTVEEVVFNFNSNDR